MSFSGNKSVQANSDQPIEIVADESKSRLIEEIACEECGKFGAHKVGDHFLCVDCYQNKGSCCAECEEDGSAGA